MTTAAQRRRRIGWGIGLAFAGALIGMVLGWIVALEFEGERNAAQQGEAVAEAQAGAAKDSLEALCGAGYQSACDAAKSIGEVDDPETQDFEIQEPEVQEAEIQEPEGPDAEQQNPELDDADPDDPEKQDGEVQDGEVQDGEVDDPENQEAEEQDPEIQDEEIQDPEKDDPDPNDPPVCEGEFVCEAELAAALADYMTRNDVVALLRALGCEVDSPGAGQTFICTITGKP